MKEFEATGRTVEEAVEMALKQLGVAREEVEVQVLEEGNRGFLGLLGRRKARVRVSLSPRPEELIRNFLEKVLEALKVKAAIEIRKREEGYFVDFHGRDLGILIGHHGDHLDALQYLCNLAVNRRLKNKIKIFLDVQGYRRRREQALVNLARRLSHRVKTTGRRIALEPMNPQERRIIHMALKDDRDVFTFSEGEEPNRKVIIALRK